MGRRTRRFHFMEAVEQWGRLSASELPYFPSTSPHHYRDCLLLWMKRGYYPYCVLRKVFESFFVFATQTTIQRLLNDLERHQEVYRVFRYHPELHAPDHIFDPDTPPTETAWFFLPKLSREDEIQIIPPLLPENQLYFIKTQFSLISTNPENGRVLAHLIGMLHRRCHEGTIRTAQNSAFATQEEGVEVRINVYPETKECWVNVFWPALGQGTPIERDRLAFWTAERLVFRLTNLNKHRHLRDMLAREESGRALIPSFPYNFDQYNFDLPPEVNGNLDVDHFNFDYVDDSP